ncbi:MAG: Gfo/Idh/MocA family oxidoreductase [Kiritimatiellia bacterium]
MNRRQVLKTSAAAAASFLILPSGARAGRTTPGGKLNIALIGTWGRAFAHDDMLKGENVVALCDVNANHLADAARKYPGAKTYADWRLCLEQKDIDSVVICTPDHVHSFIAMWAMNRGMHVYCEKPLANTVAEARLVRETYLKNRDKIATQVGTQRHEKDNFARIREMVRDGAIGELKSAYAWGNRKLGRPGYLPADGTPPSHLNWDLWLGPSKEHPYNPGYFSGGAGMNCLSWNMYWDFGSGQVGDMGSHTMDLVWNAIDAKPPTEIEAEGDAFNPDVTPVKLRSVFNLPANDWRPAIQASWHQGGDLPKSPWDGVNIEGIGHGAMFKGSLGYIVADFDNRLLLPYGKGADLTHYKVRTKDQLTPSMGNFQMQWVKACKGDLKTSCNFDYAGTMIETMLLGLVAYRAGKKLSYDSAAGKITNDDAANALLSKEYRAGWVLNG